VDVAVILWTQSQPAAGTRIRDRCARTKMAETDPGSGAWRACSCHVRGGSTRARCRPPPDNCGQGLRPGTAVQKLRAVPSIARRFGYRWWCVGAPSANTK
jgi:hypothetical protein